MRRSFAVLVCLLGIATVEKTFALPADLTPPTPTLGNAQRDGTLLVTYDLREADFGGGLRLPMRWVFNSGDQGASPYGWAGFSCTPLEAKAVALRPDMVEVTLLCGKKLYFARQFAPGSGGISSGPQWKSSDGQWTGSGGPTTAGSGSGGSGASAGDDSSTIDFTITSWDGWELEFDGGRIARLKTDDNRTLRWEYDSVYPGVVKRIYEVANNNTVVSVERESSSVIDSYHFNVGKIIINGDEYIVNRANDTLSGIDFPDGRKVQWTFTDDGSDETKLKLTYPSGKWASWVYDEKTRLLRRDDAWEYAFAGDMIQTTERVSTKLGSGGSSMFSIPSGAASFSGGTSGGGSGGSGFSVTSRGVAYDRPFMQRLRIATGEKETLAWEANNSIESRTDVYGNITKTYSYKSVSFDGINASSGSGGGSSFTSTAESKLYGKPYKIERQLAGESEFTTIWRGSYDSSNGDLLRSYDANDNETTYTYERFSGASEFQPPKKVTITDPLGRVSSVERDINADVIETIDPAGVKRKFAYDSRHRLTQMKNADNQILMRLTYGDLDQIERVYDAFEKYSEITYALHLGVPLLTKIKSPLGREQEWTRDAQGLVTEVKSASGATWDYSYLEGTAFPEAITDPLSHTVQYTYDDRLNVSGITDEMGNQKNYLYDDLDLPREVKDALDHVVKYEFSGVGDLKKLTDARNNEYTRTWRLPRRSKVWTWPNGATEQITYDAKGLVSSWKPLGNDAVVNYTRNEVGEVSAATWTNGAASGSFTITRNAAGQITGTASSDGTDAVDQMIGYNTEGRVSSLSQSAAGVTRAAAITYDLMGRLKTITYPAGFQVEYVYNDDGQISSIKKGSTTLATYTYDGAGRLSARTLSSGVVTTYGYDTMDRLNALTVTSGATTLWAERYGYNAAGQRVFTLKGATGTSGDAYSLDNTYKLTGVKYGASNADAAFGSVTGASASSSWTYDAAGNRASASDGGTTTYTSNTVNQYTAVGGTTVSYTSRGDLAGRGGWQYTYDASGNIIQGVNTASSVTVKYRKDAFGNRALKEVGGNKIAYLNAGYLQLEAYNVTTTSPSGTIYEPGIDRPLAEVDGGGNVVFYHQDWLGNVVLLTSSSGTVVEKYTYDAWGNVAAKDTSESTVSADSIRSRFLYTGRQFDPETGLYYYRARSYSADLGRFVSRDPIGEAGGINLYGYVSNNPFNFFDPYGLDRRTGSDAGGITNNSSSPVTVYEPETGTQTVGPGETSSPEHDWDSVESPAGSGNWEKIGPGMNEIDTNGDIDSNIKRWLDKLLRPDRYKPGNFPVPPPLDLFKDIHDLNPCGLSLD